METIINGLRSVLGTPDFWKQMQSTSSSGYTSYQWDYGLMIEYFIAGLLLCIVVSNVFAILRSVFRR